MRLQLEVHKEYTKMGLDELCGKGLIKLVLNHTTQMIYTRNERAEGTDVEEVVEKALAASKEPKPKKVNAKKAAKATKEEDEAEYKKLWLSLLLLLFCYLLIF